MSSKPKIIAIVGPTASGKTALAITLSRAHDGEIVSADSRQIYRGMDIGTAKPTTEELRAVPHHLIDIKDPDEEYTVAEYKRDAIAAIEDIARRGKLPILAGGTGLYVKAVLDNLDIPRVKPDPALRKKIAQEIEEHGLEAAFKRLVALDPEATYIVDPKNPRRVVRALEVAETTGIPFTAQRKKSEPLFDACTIGLNPPPEILHERINARADQMMKDGLLKEVKDLVARYDDRLTAFDAIGYREIIAHLRGTLTLEEAVALIKTNTWQFARRQMTWFRNDKNIHWIKSAEANEAENLVRDFLMK
ncbi:MAG TPA: tRNA (adenosine(37)-N6)-dimethylallyltransferase MiaA [Candidatus Paceibacterota bacterium]|jgi:tRNA dimethylallyltransferase|nr:tRNA (adenosine(37)-N6)-dimethylallyltransferase MiaA [Candidatus Paceibacterota bacterium]